VEVRLKGARRYRVLAKVKTDALGYWSLHSSVRGEYWRVLWTSPQGVTYEGPPIKAF
jgi:hypothetical protein